MSYEVFIGERLKSKQYIHKSEAKKDILNALRAFGDLHPEEDIYVHTDGSRRDLICLKGTIPVNYKGSVYNIPVQIWLLTSHPYTAPLVYVRPTSNMMIKPSKHVDNAGRVYMPYLSEWKTPKSDTYGMINMMCMKFGGECPVYSKPSGPPPRPGYTPYPSGGSNPGYPTHNTGMPQPNYPPQAAYPRPQQQNLPSYTPYPTTQPSTGYPPSTGYQTQPATNSQPPRPTNQRQDSIIQEELIRASLLSNAEDKLKRRVKEVFQMGKDELQILESKKKELESGSRNLQDMVKKMTDEKANLESNVSVLRQKNQELETTLEKLERDSDNMNIDETVVTTAPLYTQILNLFAEENAVEDAMYYLSDALRREVIELEVFLKTVRELSRRQFVLRATLQKARATAGLSSNLLGR